MGEAVQTCVELHTVYFTGEGEFLGMNKNVESPYGDDLEELKESLLRMLGGV